MRTRVSFFNAIEKRDAKSGLRDKPNNRIMIEDFVKTIGIRWALQSYHHLKDEEFDRTLFEETIINMIEAGRLEVSVDDVADIRMLSYFSKLEEYLLGSAELDAVNKLEIQQDFKKNAESSSPSMGFKYNQSE